MTVPLPGGMADRLLIHMSTCRVCRAAKIQDTPEYCFHGRMLIKSTINERHGVNEQSRASDRAE